ncbi:MAG: RES family NAD+ phosphorylase [Actinomycetota bacterium]|nr:RES family NAD+ phosphorylase [Actinomycetota bacterium]
MTTWRVEPPRLAGTWKAFRQVPHREVALYHSAGAPTPDQPSGRWHRVGEGYAQYLALEPLAAWAELVRNENIRSTAQALAFERDLYLALVEETDIADLSSFDAYERCGLDPRIAVGDHSVSQDLADELRAARFRGILSPSAALPFGTSLTLFGERYEKVLPTGLERWTNPDPTRRVPVTLTATGTLPTGLLMSTCFDGMRHEAYRQWLRDNGKPAPSGPP